MASWYIIYNGNKTRSRGGQRREKNQGRQRRGVRGGALASGFVLVSLASYHPGDPSIFSNARVHQRLRKGGCVFSGSVLQAFGLSAFLLPIALGTAGATARRQDGWRKITVRLCASTVCAVALTVLLTVQWKYWSYRGSLILTGGAFGAWLSDAMLLQLNQTGANIFALAVFLASFALATPYAVLKFVAVRVWSGSAILGRAAQVAVTRRVPPAWAWFKAWAGSRYRDLNLVERVHKYLPKKKAAVMASEPCHHRHPQPEAGCVRNGTDSDETVDLLTSKTPTILPAPGSVAQGTGKSGPLRSKKAHEVFDGQAGTMAPANA